MEDQGEQDEKARRHSPISHPSPKPSSTPASQWDETDFTTATDVVPLQVSLERVEIGRWKYVGTELDDLEMLYELESSDLLIKCCIRGTDGVAPPATFRIRDVSAADLSLTSVVPGSLESMVARLVLETEDPVDYTVHGVSDEEGDMKTIKPKVKASGESGERGERGKSDAIAGERKEVKRLNSHVVVMTASIHEAGHMRDILLFLKGGYAGKVSPDSQFLSPSVEGKKEEEEEGEVLAESVVDGTASLNNEVHQITFMEPLPFWVQYIPWWLYSRGVRRSIQKIIFLYSFFSVIWALWQLYRHVNIIHNVLEPIIAALRIYLSSVMETFDWFFAIFTDFWMRFLSPLNILQGILLAPLLQALLQLKTIFMPIVQFFLPLFTPIWRCLTNSQLLSALRALFVALYELVHILGQSLWTMLVVVTKPLYLLWQSVLNSRIAVASLDLRRLKVSWVASLVMGSLRAIGTGSAKLFGYHKTKQKQIRAKKHPSQFFHSPSPRAVGKHPRMPVYYSSPLTKQD